MIRAHTRKIENRLAKTALYPERDPAVRGVADHLHIRKKDRPFLVLAYLHPLDLLKRAVVKDCLILTCIGSDGHNHLHPRDISDTRHHRGIAIKILASRRSDRDTDLHPLGK